MTAFRSQTDAMLAAKFDPEPWRSPLPVPETSEYVRADYVVPGWVLDPRPEFIPPYTRHTLGVTWLDERSEPNPILVAFRDTVTWNRTEPWMLGADAQVVLSDMDEYDATPDQIEHARKVLTRLANLTTKEPA